jgi:putative membrane protein
MASEKSKSSVIEQARSIYERERTLRDELAIERTKLAQERTHLAYIRTGITLMLGGVFFIGYFPEGSVYLYVGYATIVVAVLFELYGFYHHKKTKRFVDTVVNELLTGET